MAARNRPGRDGVGRFVSLSRDPRPQMFAHQLTAETVPSLWRTAHPQSLNDNEAIRLLLEQSTGYTQFRVVLPGTVTWAQTTTPLRGQFQPQTVTSLEQAVRSYMPEDRGRVVDTISAAILERKGFRITARMRGPDGRVRVIETIGDVKLEGDRVTEIFGVTRDVSETVQREALAISRARLIKTLVDDMPVPVAVLDRSLRVVSASVDWVKAYGLESQEAVLGKALGKLIDVGREMTPALVEALNGKSARVTLKFYGAEDSRQLRRICAVLPWHSGGETTGGVLLVYGSADRVFASPDIADNVMGRQARSLIQLLETLGS